MRDEDFTKLMDKARDCFSIDELSSIFSRELPKKEEIYMKNYHTNENFTIWENEEFEYFIQINGQEVEDKAYRTAAEAIEEAYKR